MPGLTGTGPWPPCPLPATSRATAYTLGKLGSCSRQRVQKKCSRRELAQGGKRSCLPENDAEGRMAPFGRGHFRVFLLGLQGSELWLVACVGAILSFWMGAD